MGKSTHWLLAGMLLLTLAACERGDETSRSAAGQDAAPVKADPAFQTDDATWRAQRKEELLKPDGWTSLIGLHWIELKAHYLGSSPSSGIRLAMGPAKMGLLQQNGDRVFFTPERGTELTLDGNPLKGRVELKSDHAQTPSVVAFDEGKGALSVIQRGHRRALRVKHAEAPTRLQFTGLDYWPADASWKIEGKFIPHPAGKTILIMDIVGTAANMPNPGAVEFVRDGKTLRIEALEGSDGTLFLVLADRTSGHGSYPAGRFMDVPMPDAQGKVVLDFNRAYNSPCAFTSFATCPLPPPGNRLDLAITAGEKNYANPSTP
ncbi:MAG TPA: DUF1684 domain-containing protein [Pseudoxanthomonas sp.]